jgi:hypothetical protein
MLDQPRIANRKALKGSSESANRVFTPRAARPLGAGGKTAVTFSSVSGTVSNSKSASLLCSVAAGEGRTML